MKFEEPNIQPRAEKEQTPEEIRSVLETALKKGIHVDLVITTLDGKEFNPVPDLIVDEFFGDELMMTYIVEDGDVGEGIPLSFARIRKAELRE